MMQLLSACFIIITLMFSGCYIPTGKYRVTYKVTHVRADGVECPVGLTNKRPDGWIIITPCEDKENDHSTN